MGDFIQTYIYGAGDFGQRLYNYLKRYTTIQVNGFVQSTKPERDIIIDGFRVLSFDEISNIKEAFFLIAINDDNAKRNIRTQLELSGFSSEDWTNFVRDNLIVEQFNKRSFCVVCGNYVNHFEKGGVDAEIFRNNHVIGAGMREVCVCPKCGSLDRYRWLYYVLRKYTGAFCEDKAILHFAAEPLVADKIREKNHNYITAEITPRCADVVADITNIPFRDKWFDYVIANHVLEHVVDEEKAINELKRVVKKDAKIILSFPINMDADTDEDNDANYMVIEERLRRFGQEDHVRLYGKDYIERLEKYSLNVEIYSPKDICTKEEIEKFGFISDDVIMICTVI